MCVPKKVEREPYGGPVAKLSNGQPQKSLSPVQYAKKNRDEQVTNAGHRDLHKSGFSLSGRNDRFPLLFVEMHCVCLLHTPFPVT